MAFAHNTPIITITILRIGFYWFGLLCYKCAF